MLWQLRARATSAATGKGPTVALGEGGVEGVLCMCTHKAID